MQLQPLTNAEGRPVVECHGGQAMRNEEPSFEVQILTEMKSYSSGLFTFPVHEIG